MKDLPPPAWFALGRGAAPPWLSQYPKLAQQDQLLRRSLQVPAGWLGRSDACARSLDLQSAPRWILRSVLPGEDEPDHLYTGMSLSLGGITGPEALLEAQAKCRAHLQLRIDQGLLDPGLSGQLAWLVQAQVEARHYALVILSEPAKSPAAPDRPVEPRELQRCYVELYPPVDDPFSGRCVPLRRGDLQRIGLPEEQSQALDSQIQALRAAVAEAPALEAEFVQDQQDHWWCVQAKRTRRGAFENYQDFLALAAEELGARGQSLLDYEELSLDAEHNPEPLSAAHRWLVEKLQGDTKRASYVVLANWLFKVGAAPPPKTGPAQDIYAALHKLRDELLPAAQRRIELWPQELARLFEKSVQQALQSSLDLCLEILQSRSRHIDPVRKSRPPRLTRSNFDFATTLDGRSDFAAALPTRWDISAPSLLQAQLPPSTQQSNAQLPADEASAWDLLEEWDDHLFALALQAPRALWLHAARQWKLSSEALFSVDGESLVDYARGQFPKSALERRCQLGLEYSKRMSQLAVPLRILHGWPAPPTLAHKWRGIPFGPSVEGVLYKRQDLEDLLQHPLPGPRAILAIWALTAPAALALHRVGIQAVVCAYGGVSSHGARMAAELGVSALIGCPGCMEIPDGQKVALDTQRALLFWTPQGPPVPDSA